MACDIIGDSYINGDMSSMNELINFIKFVYKIKKILPLFQKT